MSREAARGKFGMARQVSFVLSLQAWSSEQRKIDEQFLLCSISPHRKSYHLCNVHLYPAAGRRAVL